MEVRFLFYSVNFLKFIAEIVGLVLALGGSSDLCVCCKVEVPWW